MHREGERWPFGVCAVGSCSPVGWALPWYLHTQRMLGGSGVMPAQSQGGCGEAHRQELTYFYLPEIAAPSLLWEMKPSSCCLSWCNRERIHETPPRMFCRAPGTFLLPVHSENWWRSHKISLMYEVTGVVTQNCHPYGEMVCREPLCPGMS